MSSRSWFVCAVVVWAAASCLTPVPAHAVTYDLAPVGNAGNVADTTTYGAVAYDYQIGKNGVTIGQYTAFLNAVATTLVQHSFCKLPMWVCGSAELGRHGCGG